MDDLYLGDILHMIAQGFLNPDKFVLVALVLYTVFQCGSFLVELIGERRHFKLVMPDFLNALDRASLDEIPEVISESGLLKRQKAVLMCVFDNRHLPEDSRFSLAQREIFDLGKHYGRIVGRVDAVSKIAPMFGLMGTLIPLGPGIAALGRGDTVTLSSSLLLAFDTTVAGLIAAAFCFVIARIRKRWYEDYMMALKTSATTVLEKLEIIEEAEGPFERPAGDVADEPGGRDESRPYEGASSRSNVGVRFIEPAQPGPDGRDESRPYECASSRSDVGARFIGPAQPEAGELA